MTILSQKAGFSKEFFPAPSTDRINWELAASGISPEIARKHFRCVEGDEAVELIAGELLSRVGGHGKQYVTAEVSRILRRYGCLRDGGWVFQGLDPLDDFGPMDWQVMKPINPRITSSGKPIKYESPAGVPTRVFIAGDPDEWRRWQRDPSVPIVITEGCKKAASAQSHGIPVIGLSGIWNGSKKDEQGIHRLIPELLSFCVPGRLWQIDFDCDTKPKTRKQVAKAIGVLSRLLEQQGQRVAIVRRDHLPHKGTDDFIVAEGIEAYRKCLENAEPLDLWQVRRVHHGSRSLAGQKVIYSDLSELDAASLPTAGIVGIRSPKGTGKTKLLNRIVAEEERVVALSHRISLGRNLSERLDLIWQEDRRMGWQQKRLASTVDSLLRILPTNVEGGTLVLDEASQIIRHLLTSSTLKRRRGAIIRRFRELVAAAERVVVADADLTQLEIDYLAEIRGEVPFVLVNKFIPAGAQVRMLDCADPSVVLEEIDRAVRAGERLYICTNSLQTANRLEASLSLIRRVLLLTSRTSGGKEQRAFLRDPDAWLTANPGVIVITSPTVGSGLSIEGSHFDKVIGIFGAESITAADAAQALGRVRANIPRLVWAAPGRTTPEGSNRLRIVGDECQRLAASAYLGGGFLAEIQKILGQGSPELTLWGEITARANWSRAHMRAHLRVILEDEGGKITVEKVAADPDWKDIWRELGRLCKRRDAERVGAAPAITPERAELLAAAPWKSPEDADSLDRHYIERFYCTRPNADLILADDGGRRRQALRRLEGMAFVNIPKAFDQQQANNLDPRMPTIWDLSHSTLERTVMESIGLGEFLNWAMAGEEWNNDTPAVVAVADKVRANAEGIRQGLRLTVRRTMSNCQIIGELLHRLGLKTAAHARRVPVVPPPQLEGNKRKGVTGQKTRVVRFYRLDMEHLAEVQAILQRRHERRQASDSAIPVGLLPDTPLARWIMGGSAPRSQMIPDDSGSSQLDSRGSS